MLADRRETGRSRPLRAREYDRLFIVVWARKNKRMLTGSTIRLRRPDRLPPSTVFNTQRKYSLPRKLLFEVACHTAMPIVADELLKRANQQFI